MGRRGIVSLAIGLSVLALPATAAAVRPATEPEIAAFEAAAKRVEVADCAELARARNSGATASNSCPMQPRPDYDPVITEAEVSTLDERWATARIDPGPKSIVAESAIFRAEDRATSVAGTPGATRNWLLVTTGQYCTMNRIFGTEHGADVSLMPDLVEAMGCIPVIPTKVRCLDKFRIRLLALEEPTQCAVAAPPTSPLAGWMNIRELRWHRWGSQEPAWATGVLRQVPRRLVRPQPAVGSAGRSVSKAVPVSPIVVRLVASQAVSCGTSYFYSSLRVASPFGHFSVSLPTCPDVFFAPAG